MFPAWPATRFTFLAAMILPLTLLSNANAHHWLLGDENAVHCYSADPSQPDTAEQKDMVIKGVSMKWTVPIPASAQLAAGRPIESAITVSLSPEFFQDNNSSDLGTIGIRSNDFQNLCYKKIAPNGNAACATSVSPSPENCCIYHANVHACRQEEKGCQPWVQPMNSSSASNYVLVTHTNSVTGFPDNPIFFENLVLPADTWTIISHIKIMHFQCAIGVLRTIRNVDTLSTAQANDNSRQWATWQIALLISGCILAVLLISGIVFFVHRKRKANQTANQHINNPNNNDQTSSFTNIQRQSTTNTLRFSQTYVSPPVSPSQPQYQDVQRYSMMSNPYQPMIYVPCEQYPPPQNCYATYLSPQAPLTTTPMASSDSNMVPMCCSDPNGRYITYNQNYSYQQPSQPSQYPLRVVGDPNTSSLEGTLPVYSDDPRQHPMDYSFAASSTGKSDRS